MKDDFFFYSNLLKGDELLEKIKEFGEPVQARNHDLLRCCGYCKNYGYKDDQYKPKYLGIRREEILKEIDENGVAEVCYEAKFIANYVRAIGIDQLKDDDIEDLIKNTGLDGDYCEDN